MKRLIGVVGAVAVCLSSTNESAGQDWVVPIVANSPQLVVGLTDERARDDLDWVSATSSSPGGNSLPNSSSPAYEVFVLDTGAPLTIMDPVAAANFGIEAAGLGGSNAAPIAGVVGFNSDPLGIYAAGFDSITSTNPIQVNESDLLGQTNSSVVYAPSGEGVFNVIGTNLAMQYTTEVSYGQPHILEDGDETFRSPGVNIATLGSTAEPSRRIEMRVDAASAQTGIEPSFFPSLANFDDFADDPLLPTIAARMSLQATIRHKGNERTGLQMLFDTGAQGTLVSEQVAATLGFDVENDEPDFAVRITGFGGGFQEAPGFYAEEFVLPGTDGGLVLRDVPLIAFNISADGFNTLDALLGMNVFADRNLTINPEPGNVYLGVSDSAVDTHSWGTNSQTGSWSTDTNWDLSGVPTINWHANVRNVSGSPQFAVISSDSTINSFVVGGTSNNATMTMQIEQGAVLTLVGTGIVQEHGRINLQGGTLDPAALEVRMGEISGDGQVNGEVISQGIFNPGGTAMIGSLRFGDNVDILNRSTVQIELNGDDNSDNKNPQFDTVVVEGEALIGGHLEVNSLADFANPKNRGETQELSVYEAERIFGSFDIVSFDGSVLVPEVILSSGSEEIADGFRTHVGDGLFRGVTYESDKVLLSNYFAIAGDADGDGDVDTADLTSVTTNWTGALDPGVGSATFQNGDFDGDGDVDTADRTLVVQNWTGAAQAIRSSTNSIVPEPSGLTVLLFMILGGALISRRRLHS